MPMVEESLEYLKMREGQEREAAARAPTAEITQIHLDLAGKYRQLADIASKRHTD